MTWLLHFQALMKVVSVESRLILVHVYRYKVDNLNAPEPQLAKYSVDGVSEDNILRDVSFLNESDLIVIGSDKGDLRLSRQLI